MFGSQRVFGYLQVVDAEQMEPELRNNEEVVARLEAFETSWAQGARYLPRADRLDARDGLVLISRSARSDRRSWRSCF